MWGKYTRINVLYWKLLLSNIQCLEINENSVNQQKDYILGNICSRLHILKTFCSDVFMWFLHFIIWFLFFMCNLWVALFSPTHIACWFGLGEFWQKEPSHSDSQLFLLYPLNQELVKSTLWPWVSLSDVFNLSSNIMVMQTLGGFIISPFSPATHSQVLDFLI